MCYCAALWQEDDVQQWLLPVEIMWHPAQMACWFGGLNATHSPLWDLRFGIELLAQTKLHTLGLNFSVQMKYKASSLLHSSFSDILFPFQIISPDFSDNKSLRKISCTSHISQGMHHEEGKMINKLQLLRNCQTWVGPLPYMIRWHMFSYLLFNKPLTLAFKSAGSFWHTMF